MPAGCIKVKTLQDIMVSYLLNNIDTAGTAPSCTKFSLPVLHLVVLQVKHSRNCEDHYAADLDDFLSSFCMGTSGNVNFQEMLAQCGSRMVL